MAAAKGTRTPRRIVLVGATASGKSEVALRLAARFDSEIVGADSRQIYRGLEIGTAAPSAAERAVVPHHFVSFLDPSETYNAGRYGREARAAIEAIETRGRLAIVVGGSGLYIRALVQGLFEGPGRDEGSRVRLHARLRAEGLAPLREELGRVDPEALRGILPGDSVRVIRALEVHELTGRRISELRRERARDPFPATFFGLRWPRGILAGRIAQRIEGQLARGFLEEARRLREATLPEGAPGPRTLGYRELIAHLNGAMSLDVARSLIALKSRQLAKRQETWFRSVPEIAWFDLETAEDLVRAEDAIAERIEGTPGRSAR